MLLFSCQEDSPFVSDTNLVVVQAYLYANEPVRDIRLTSTLPLDAADSTKASPINDAHVILSKNGQSYLLEASAGDSGYYHSDSVEVKVGDVFNIEIEYNDELITGETEVPEAPENVTISSDTLELPAELNPWDFKPGEFDSLELIVEWTNDNEELYYIVLDNIETNPTAIDIGLPPFPGRFISQPVNRDSYPIRLPMLTHYGLHRVIVYRINQEYGDLYLSRNQDSRDLNEPLTNIENGLGVFSAFNSDSVFFNVIQN